MIFSMPPKPRISSAARKRKTSRYPSVCTVASSEACERVMRAKRPVT